jgi:hypothetical protein
MEDDVSVEVSEQDEGQETIHQGTQQLQAWEPKAVQQRNARRLCISWLWKQRRRQQRRGREVCTSLHRVEMGLRRRWTMRISRINPRWVHGLAARAKVGLRRRQPNGLVACPSLFAAIPHRETHVG